MVVLGEIMTEECRELVAELLNDKHSAKDCNDISMYIDTSVYKKFVTNACFIGATTFMKNDGEDSDESRVNTLYCLKRVSKSKNFKAEFFQKVHQLIHSTKLAFQ